MDDVEVDDVEVDDVEEDQFEDGEDELTRGRGQDVEEDGADAGFLADSGSCELG